MAGDVLEKSIPWLDLSEYSGDVWPKVSRIVGSTPRPGDGERLAWVPANDAIHNSTERSPAESSNIREYRCRIQGTVLHTRFQYRASIGFSLHVSDRASVSYRSSDPDVQSSPPGTNADDIERGISHIKRPPSRFRIPPLVRTSPHRRASAQSIREIFLLAPVRPPEDSIPRRTRTTDAVFPVALA